MGLDMKPDESPETAASLVKTGDRERPGSDSRGAWGRPQRRTPPAYKVCEGLTEAILYFTIVFNPWVFGTTQPWAIRVMNAAGYALGTLLAAKWIIGWAKGFSPARWDRRAGQERGRGLAPGMAVMTALFLGYVLLGAVNARASFFYDAQVFTYFQCIAWLPHSYDRTATWFAFWQWLGLACVFWAARDWLLGMSGEERRGLPGRNWQDDYAPGRATGGAQLGRDVISQRLKRLLLVLCLTGALVGLEGMAQRAAGADKVLFMIQPRYRPSGKAHFGPYANRNNAAEYFNLLWPVCAGFAFVSAQAARRARREGARKPGRSPLWLTGGAVVMGACPLISGSRGGALIAMAMAPVVLAVMLAVPRALSVSGKIGLCLLFAAALELSVIFSWGYLQERFATVFTDDLSGRLVLYKNAQAMAKDFAVFGCGAGTFESAYHLYRRDPGQEWAAFLHNDWLELRITLGWTGLGMVLALLGGALLHRFWGRGLPLPNLLAITLWIALAGCLVHARFDFPFGVHSIATVFLLYCSILSASGRWVKT